MKKRIRLDEYLSENKICESIDKAKKEIIGGWITVNGETIRVPSKKITGTEKITAVRPGGLFVSRGGEKLLHALKYFNISVKGKIIADLGASTGGFTDCLLQHGAAFDSRGIAIGIRSTRLESCFVHSHDQLQLPVAHQLVPIFDHTRDLVARVDMNQRKGDAAEKRLACQPQQDGGVLSDAPKHGEVLKLVVRLSEDVDALAFQMVQGGSHMVY